MVVGGAEKFCTAAGAFEVQGRADCTAQGSPRRSRDALTPIGALLRTAHETLRLDGRAEAEPQYSGKDDPDLHGFRSPLTGGLRDAAPIFPSAAQSRPEGLMSFLLIAATRSARVGGPLAPVD